jgi:hypothetical protein
LVNWVTLSGISEGDIPIFLKVSYYGGSELSSAPTMLTSMLGLRDSL